MTRVQRSAMGFAYYAYGLTYRSELRLPELPSVSTQPEVEISIGTVNQKPQGGNANETAVEVGVNTTCLSHSSVGAFRVCNGNSITVEPAAGVDAGLLRLFLLGPALGTLLRQRGCLTLHASAVVIGGVAVLFAGHSGAGKSTTAAAFHASGCRLLADDIVALDMTSPRPMVLPGFPRVKLDGRAATAARMRNRQKTVGNDAHAKRYFRADHGFASDPVPLGRVFVLIDDDRCAIDRLQPSEALVELLRHSYGPRSLQALHREAHFKQCAAVARLIPVGRLERPMALEGLTALMRLVHDDLAKS